MSTNPQETPLTPVPDRLSPPVMPGGRGTETHGVKPTDPWRDVPAVATDEAIVVPPEPEPEPVPVKVINQSARERKAWRVVQAVVGAEPVRIVGTHERRTKLTMRNVGLSDIFIAPDPNVNAITGWTLGQASANENLTLDAQTEVWGILVNPANAPSQIDVIIEYTEEM